MPEYVYALHDFLPEHEDEVTFRSGERIEVVEKDDLYGDGWWQGRNLAGKVGLFPVSYTTQAPPSAPSSAPEKPQTAKNSVLQPLAEESEYSDSPQIVSPVPKQLPATFLNGDGYGSDFGPTDNGPTHPAAPVPDGEVMKATMTDVQKAIEQLGRRGMDGDGARSFSFASTRDGADTETDETDFDLSDIDGAAGDSTGDWHKSARHKLAAKARRAVEEAEKLEAMMDSPSGRRSVAPPIEVELSDESDDEGDFTRSSKFQRNHPYILEEDENEGIESHIKEASTSVTETQSSETVENQIVVPPMDETEVPTATATQPSFPVFFPPQSYSPAPAPDPTPTPIVKPVSPPPTISPPPLPAAVTTQIILTEKKQNSEPAKEIALSNGLPSPSVSSHFNNISNVNSKHNSIVSSSSAPQTQTRQTFPSAPVFTRATHPSEWSVEEVVEWLKAKGFDQDACDRFTEQEITGDVLLELDVNLLKSEIGILAFGKRMRIANAIADLRRPPSVEYSGSDRNDPSTPSEQPSPIQLQYPHSNTHSRNQSQSQSQSHHSFPGGTVNTLPPQGVVHAYQQSIQSSLGSPIHLNGFGNTSHSQNQNQSQFEPVLETETQSLKSGSDAVVEVDKTPAADVGNGTADKASAGLGLSIELPQPKPRSVQLALSPSDGALKDTALRSILSTPKAEEDRGHMSDGEIAPTTANMRRRLLGWSQESSLSAPSGHSGTTRISSPNPEEDKDLKDKAIGKDKGSPSKDKDSGRDSISVGGRHKRGKKSIDAGKHVDTNTHRLSLFGSTFSGTLGKAKNRKPVPSAIDENGHVLGSENGKEKEKEKLSTKFSLPRLHGPGSIRKSTSTPVRPTTPGQSPKDHSVLVAASPSSQDRSPTQDKDFPRNSNTLRKRTVSAPPTNLANLNSIGIPDIVDGVSGPIKQGQNILDQIGEPDHTGWMRKKGDRYNAWKLRYFILKGPHMYCLKSNNKTETRIKGYIHIVGYKVTVDETIDPGRYGFRIDHDHDKTYYFSSEEKTIVRDWMKAIMKATIGRDYSKPVVSSCNIPTIPLVVAQAMNPAPRPPSPSARDATQKALRRDNPDQLSGRDARILMGLTGNDPKDDRTRLDTFFSEENKAANDWTKYQPASPRRTSAPPRPSRELRRSFSISNTADDALIEWANTHLPEHLQITDPSGPLCGGLALLRLAESIKGRPMSPPVVDSAFPSDAYDEKLDGLFKLFDFLLDNDVKMGSVSINDVRQGKREKIVQLLKALKAWEDKRRAVANTFGSVSQAGGFIAPSLM